MMMRIMMMMMLMMLRTAVYVRGACLRKNEQRSPPRPSPGERGARLPPPPASVPPPPPLPPPPPPVHALVPVCSQAVRPRRSNATGSSAPPAGYSLEDVLDCRAVNAPRRGLVKARNRLRLHWHGVWAGCGSALSSRRSSGRRCSTMPPAAPGRAGPATRMPAPVGPPSTPSSHSR